MHHFATFDRPVKRFRFTQKLRHEILETRPRLGALYPAVRDKDLSCVFHDFYAHEVPEHAPMCPYAEEAPVSQRPKMEASCSKRGCECFHPVADSCSREGEGQARHVDFLDEWATKPGQHYVNQFDLEHTVSLPSSNARAKRVDCAVCDHGHATFERTLQRTSADILDVATMSRFSAMYFNLVKCRNVCGGKFLCSIVKMFMTRSTNAF